MFRAAKTFIKKIMDLPTKKAACEQTSTDASNSDESIVVTIDIDSIIVSASAPASEPASAPASAPEPASEPASEPEPASAPASEPAPTHVPALDDYIYEHDAVVINRWENAARDDIVPLIAMIRQLYFFSECKKTTLRTYASCKDDVSIFIGKIKRRPALQIDVTDVDVYDHPQMFKMHLRLRNMIGMFRINEFMVRVEHAFDNSQIESEHFVVSKLMKYATKHDMVVGNGIDSVHHIVLPLHVHLKSICKIPVNVRTLFHHISYSIQPIVHHSQTLDIWFKRAIASPTDSQIMQLCIQMAEALAHLHAANIVHGDIKPGNTLIKINYEYADSGSGSGSSDSTKSSDSENESLLLPPSPSLYLIDFGMSGIPGCTEGTGGTKPFCAPETGNGFNPLVDMDKYTWTKIQKCHDVWSFALMFFTMFVLRKLYIFPKDYPSNFFDVDRKGYINPEYFDRIQDEPTRELFRRALAPHEERMTSAEFLTVANVVLRSRLHAPTGV